MGFAGDIAAAVTGLVGFSIAIRDTSVRASLPGFVGVVACCGICAGSSATAAVCVPAGTVKSDLADKTCALVAWTCGASTWVGEVVARPSGT